MIKELTHDPIFLAGNADFAEEEKQYGNLK